ncbi:hypothetical protein [Pseudaquabacterium pictum]|uniref:Uncharacterized protein n=1 Tax=Pseudaquabacterium pictum TaxID=2315236 RepID=A0A480AZW1_9BURK|nr:hypothetical protein [Rubrivivax pictus]GCL65842.1 hypothetical protein AQPW35_49230 [Rubrivivax pictus]
MFPVPLHRLVTPVTLVVALISAWAVPMQAEAAEQAMRLTLTAELQRQARTQFGSETARVQLRQRAEYAITLVGDGVPMGTNPLDPDEPARLLAAAQRTQQTVQAGLAAVAARGQATAAPMPDLAAMQALAQRLQAQCGQDRDCLMREATRFSAQQVAAHPAVQPADRAAVQARLQAYGADVRACERQQPAGAAREACINQARVRAGGEADAPEAEVAMPYLHFRAAEDCRPSGQLTLDERAEGSFVDVQGPVAFTATRLADDVRAPASFPCGTQLVVLDTRNGRLWVTSPVLGLSAQVTAVRSEQGRAPQRQVGGSTLDWHEAAPWLQQRLLQLDRRGGNASATLPAAADGQTQVRLSWRWQPA